MVKFMMDLRNEAEKTANLSRTEIHRDYYKSLRNLVTATIEREKKAYFQHYVNGNQKNSRKMWKHIKETSLFHQNKNNFDIPLELNNPDKINEHFMNIPGNPNVDPNLIAQFKHSRYSNFEFNFTNVTESEVYKILHSIQSNAAGHDTITIKIYFLLYHTLFLPLLIS